MKVYISADMEGITGVASWEEVDHNKPAYAQFQKQMSLEVAAACEGAIVAGAKQIMVKDAHYSGRNIIPSYLPDIARIIRGWSGHPYSMLQEINSRYDALMLVGYHARAGSGGNPLAHTMSSAKIERIFLNDRQASELLLHGTIASKYHVPLAFVSGDSVICAEIKSMSPNTITHSTMHGVGDSSISLQPQNSIEIIKRKAQKALSRDLKKCIWAYPSRFKLTIRYMKHADAFKASQYPGARMLSPKSVSYEDRDYDNIMRFILFCV